METLDADLQRGAAASEEMLQERFQAEGTPNCFINFVDFVMSEFLPAWADRSVVAQAVEKEFDLAEVKPIAPGKRMRSTRSRASLG
jgi:hypothetical protein